MYAQLFNYIIIRAIAFHAIVSILLCIGLTRKKADIKSNYIYIFVKGTTNHVFSRSGSLRYDKLKQFQLIGKGWRGIGTIG